MPDPRINLLAEHYRLNTQTKASPWLLGRFFFGTIFLGALVGISVSYATSHFSSPQNATQPPQGFFAKVASFVSSGQRTLHGEEQDRINIALLGIGGAGHDGPELTDTLLFASLRPSDGQSAILSIPRDLLAPIPEKGWWKINHANAFGEQQGKGTGPANTARVLEEILGQPIHYTVKIDFSGFEKLIDALGGVDVFVENAFTDTQYPTDDYLVQTIRFESGWQHMNGAKALMFARSRHGNNGEGSDFARAKRQQKLLVSVRDQALSAGTLLNPVRLHELFTILDTHISTNANTWELLRFAEMATAIQTDTIRHATLGIGPNAPLMESVVNGSYVLLPAKNDWAPIQRIATTLLEPSETVVGTFTPKQATTRPVRIRIENGTEVNGLAFRTSQWLGGQGFQVVGVGNASSRDAQRTTIYDISGGDFSKELRVLTDILRADIGNELPSSWIAQVPIDTRTATLTNDSSRTGSDAPTDILIILGQNAADLVLATP